MAVTSATARGIKYSCLSLTSCRAGVSRLLSFSRTNTDIHTLALQFISIRFRWLLWLSKKKKQKKKAKKKQSYCTFPQRRYGGSEEDLALLSLLPAHFVISPSQTHTFHLSDFLFAYMLCI